MVIGLRGPRGGGDSGQCGREHRGDQGRGGHKTDLATSLILNSSLQVAIALTPVLVLISLFVTGGALTLVLSPLLLGAVFLAALIAALIVFDGESSDAVFGGGGSTRHFFDHVAVLITC